MKAVEINKTGGPEVLEVKDISLDKPGPDQVTIEQKAIGLNYIDTYHRSGLYHLKLHSGLGLEGEEKNIEVALKSLVTQNYKNLEIIVVNDRSTDETASILERLAPEYSNITISNISELPLGWVGKNHALYNGAKQAKGEYLLFTDADIVMDSTAIQRAVYHMQQNKLDHIAVMPEIKMPGFILNLLCVAFYAYFGLLFKPWKVKSLKSKRSIGLGAFNMMRRQAYLELSLIHI